MTHFNYLNIQWKPRGDRLQTVVHSYLLKNQNQKSIYFKYMLLYMAFNINCYVFYILLHCIIFNVIYYDL